MEAKEQPEKSVVVGDPPNKSEDKRDEKDTEHVQAELQHAEQDGKTSTAFSEGGPEVKEASAAHKEPAKEGKGNNEQTQVTPTATVQNTKTDEGKVQGSKHTKAPLPGPTWPLDSHPDRIKEYLQKWNMIDNKTLPANAPGREDRPKGWQSELPIVPVDQQAPQKPRGRKPRKGSKEPKGSNGKDDKTGQNGKETGKTHDKEAKQPTADTSKPSKRAHGNKEKEKESESKRIKVQSAAAEPQAKQRAKRKIRTDANQEDKENKKQNLEKSEDAGKGDKVEMSEDEKRKKLLSRKSTAYKAARKKALDQGLSMEEAAKAGRQVSCLLHFMQKLIWNM